MSITQGVVAISPEPKAHDASAQQLRPRYIVSGGGAKTLKGQERTSHTPT